MLRIFLFNQLEGFQQNVTGPIIRQIGQALFAGGIKIQGIRASDDEVVKSTRCIGQNGKYPSLNSANFVAPNATISGNVSVGLDSSVWYGTTIRGDLGKIIIGRESIIQDLAQIIPNKNEGVTIGEKVYIGPNAHIESCTIENGAFIGMGATIRKGAVIKANAVIAAGAVIEADQVVPSSQIWAGNTASYLRDITNEEREALDEFLDEMKNLAEVHTEETEKSSRQVINDDDWQHQLNFLDGEDLALLKMQEIGLPMNLQDQELVEQRVLMREYESTEADFHRDSYEPYQQDLYNFPDNFKIYSENYEKYDQLKQYFDENPDVVAQPVERDIRVEPRDHSPWEKKF